MVPLNLTYHCLQQLYLNISSIYNITVLSIHSVTDVCFPNDFARRFTLLPLNKTPKSSIKGNTVLFKYTIKYHYLANGIRI